MPPRSLKSILADQIEAKDTSLDKVIDKTGIPDHYLRAIMENQVDRLPALPYIRAYLLAIADFLELDRNLVLEAYRTEFSGKMSGSADRLPGNRFTLTRKNRKWIWIAGSALVGIFIMYSVLRSAFFGVPYLRLVNPPHDADMFEAVGPTLMLAGTTEANGKLTINGEMVPVRADGSFEFEFPLAPELNTIEFKVERFLGKTLTLVKKVYVQPLEPASETAPSSDEALTDGEEESELLLPTDFQ